MLGVAGVFPATLPINHDYERSAHIMNVGEVNVLAPNLDHPLPPLPPAKMVQFSYQLFIRRIARKAYI